VKLTTKPRPLLDFDIETRRIGFHNGGKFNPDGCEPVCIAYAWGDNAPIVAAQVPTWSFGSLRDVVLPLAHELRCAANMGAIVTGHYITKFDLPIINGVLLELGEPPLPRLLVSDTKTQLINIAGLSQSQENLSRLLVLDESKFHMADQDWRMLARLDPNAIWRGRQRVFHDVVQHRALREELVKDEFLGPPEVWSP
jgi:hypothetical protein